MELFPQNNIFLTICLYSNTMVCNKIREMRVSMKKSFLHVCQIVQNKSTYQKSFTTLWIRYITKEIFICLGYILAQQKWLKWLIVALVSCGCYATRAPVTYYHSFSAIFFFARMYPRQMKFFYLYVWFKELRRTFGM